MNYSRTFFRKHAKKASVFFALLFLSELFAPTAALALTGGPTQPEMSSFEPISTNQMVDLFTGDFTYNIPLMDVGGYPINIAYHAGVGMEQEASWVGLGWNINPGVINRTVRGVPDDFSGDKIKTEVNRKADITVNAKGGLDMEIVGLPTEKESNKSKIGVSLNTGLSFTYNTYRGFYMAPDFGLNFNASVGNIFGGQVGINHSADGGIGMYASPTMKLGNDKFVGSVSPSVNYSSRNQNIGLSIQTGLYLEESNESARTGSEKKIERQTKRYEKLMNKNPNGKKAKNYKYTAREMKSLSMSGSGSIQFGSNSYIPSSAPNMTNEFGSIRGAFGLEVQSTHPAGYVEGNYMKQSLAKHIIEDGAYGYLFLHERPKTNGQFEGIADFNRDGPSGSFNPAVKYLSPSTMTYDILSVNAHGTGGMYRPFRNDVGVVSDPYYEHSSFNGLSLGLELGVGTIARTGGDAVVRSSIDRAGNWLDPQLTEYEFKPKVKGRLEENVYYKVAGEIVPITETYEAFGHDNVKSYATKTKNSLHEPGLKVDKWVKYETAHNLSPRQPRGKMVTILNGVEASEVGLDEMIKSVSGNNYATADVKEYRRDEPGLEHHTSEITQYEKDGSRYVFGIPAMNKTKEEYLFSIDSQSNPRARSTVQYNLNDASTGNSKGIDHYFSKKETPPYAHSYLLTGYLSPDYMDVTGDGITDDDIGTAVKFNWTRVHEDFGWRTPIGSFKANYAAGNEGDKNDDKASFVYGTKELWYLHSIESSHYVAVFETDNNRTDAQSISRNGVPDGKESKRLKRIVLYAKSDLSTPLKTVEFEYANGSYELCRGVPNGTNGKLTLKEIRFKYGESTGEAFAPYKFSYNKIYQNSSGNFVDGNYNPEQVDRWGNFKGYNIPATSVTMLSSSEYPYTNQEVSKDVADNWASLWNLSKIELPSGGEINIEYESDDYGYVQDKPAMEMIKVKGAGSTENWSSATNKLYHGNGNAQNYYLYFELPFDVANLPDGYTKEIAFDNMFKSFDLKNNQLYYKFYVKVVDGVAEHNGITGYATVDMYNNELVMGICPDNNKYGYVKVKPTRAGGKINKHWVNPIAANAMQYFTNYMPTYVKPGADKGAPGDFLAIANKMVTIIPDLLQMVVGPVRYMMMNGVANEFSNTASLIRVNSWDNQKFGGGYRVAKVEITDSWDTMTGSAEDESSYGQQYSYVNDDGTTSGVASYEPLLGGEENPLRYPTKYMQKKNPGVSPNWELFQETPLGETFYPTPVVGYERVVVNSIHADKPSSKFYKETRFYTAKDFPVYYENSDISVKEPHKLNGIIKPPVGTCTTKTHYSAAQGFVFFLNDMHGKMKSQSHYSVLGDGSQKVRLNGTEYIYYTERDKEKGREVLSNKVRAVLRNGDIGEIMLGKEIDLTIDSRDVYHNDRSNNIKGSLDVITLGIIPAFPLPMVLYMDENNETQVRTAVVTKIIQSHGLLHKVVTHDMNHQTTLTNELFDGHTGDLLVSRINDPFGQDHMTSLLPAYWNERYDRMGHAYRNIGFEEIGGEKITILGQCANLQSDAFDFLSYYFYEGIVDSYLGNHKQFNTSGHGELQEISGNLMTANVYVPGDEVFVMKDGVTEHLWVMNVLSPQDVEDLIAATELNVNCDYSEVTGTPNGTTGSENPGTGNTGTNGNDDPRCSNILTETAFKSRIAGSSPGLSTNKVDEILGDLVIFDANASADKVCDLLDLFPLQSKDPSSFFTNYHLDDFAFLISDGNTFSAQYQLNNTGKLIKEILDDEMLHYFIGNYFSPPQNSQITGLGALHDPDFIKFYETVLTDEQLTQYLKCTLDHPEILQFVSNLGCDQDAADLVRFSTYNWYKCFEKNPNQYTTFSALWDCDPVYTDPGAVLDPVLGLNSNSGSSGGNVPSGGSSDPKTIMDVLNQTPENTGANTTSSFNSPNIQGTNNVVNCTITCPSDIIESSSNGCNQYLSIPTINYSGDCTPIITNDMTGTNNASATYPVGTTVVTWTITYDGITTTCTQNITVNPSSPPTMTCSSKNVGNDSGKCSATVYFKPDVTGVTASCPTLTITNDYTNDSQTSATFPVGTTNVTWTLTQGNYTEKCTQTITVNDNEPPDVSQWPPDINQYADPGRQDAYVQVGQPIATDNCGNVTYTNNYNYTSDATDHYPIGTHAILWTVSDGFNNITSPAPQTIQILEDLNPHALCKDITVDLQGKTSVNVFPMDVDNGSWDHSGSLTYSLTPQTFDASNIGPNVAQLEVINAKGNKDQCSSIITVIDSDNHDDSDGDSKWVDYKDPIDNPPCSGATGVFSVGTYTDFTPHNDCEYEYENYFHNNSLQDEYWMYSLDPNELNRVNHYSFDNCSSHEYVECDYSFAYTNTVNPLDDGHNNSLSTAHANSGTPPASTALSNCCFFEGQVFDMYGKEIVIFIDRHGDIKSVENKDVKIIRSGRRNMVDTKVAEIVSVGTGPFVDNYKNAIERNRYFTENQVLRATSTTFSDYWKTDRSFETDPENVSVNPFVYGIRGNFKPHQSYYSNSNRIESENMSEAGKLKDFLPFWEFAGSMNKIAPTQASVDDWLLSNQITAYSAMHGAPLEQYVSLDQSGANNIYSTEVFGGHGKVSAVGSNIEKREIFFADFESNSYQNPKELEHINDWRVATKDRTTTTTAHTGKHSLYVDPESSYLYEVFEGDKYPPENPGPEYKPGFAVSGSSSSSCTITIPKASEAELDYQEKYLNSGYSPAVGTYIVSGWIKEGFNHNWTYTDPNSGTRQTLQYNTLATLTVEGKEVLINTVDEPFVEGWQRFYTEVDLDPSDGILINFYGGKYGAYLDDLRIFPVDGTMKSFVYDDTYQRLQAELDENNYATFYDYDHEGNLIRVRKETERGILTIQESYKHTHKQP